MAEATKITATELARNLSDILNRVRYKGERFRIERNGLAIAELGPSRENQGMYTVADFRRDLGDLQIPEGLGAAIEDARKALRSLPESPWPC